MRDVNSKWCSKLWCYFYNHNWWHSLRLGCIYSSVINDHLIKLTTLFNKLHPQNIYKLIGGIHKKYYGNGMNISKVRVSQPQNDYLKRYCPYNLRHTFPNYDREKLMSNFLNTKSGSSGQYYKHITIVNDDSKVISKWCELSVVSDASNCGVMFTIVIDDTS